MNIFYYIFIVLAAYFSYRYDWIEEYDRHKQHRLWLLCFYLICLSGFSYGLGGDKFTYMSEFEGYPDTFSEVGNFVWYKMMLRGQMPLWTIINLVCKSMFHSFYALQFIQSTAINISVCYIVSKYTHRYFLFLLIYFFSLKFFVFNTEIMREGFALSFVLIGLHGWMSGKKWLYFLSIPMGLMLHVSALTAFLFPFMRFHISWKTLLYAFLVSFSLWVLSDIVLGTVMVSVLGGMGALVHKVLFYSIQASSIFGFIRSIVTYLVFPFVIMYSVMQNEPSEEMRQRQEKLISFMVVLAILASSFAGFVRLYNAAMIFYLAMLAEFVYSLFNDRKLLIVRLCTLMGTVFLTFLTYRIHYKTTNTYYYDFFFPYTCILDEDKSVYIRDAAHREAVAGEEKDNNVRNVE